VESAIDHLFRRGLYHPGRHDPRVFQALSTRNGGEIISADSL